VRSGWGSMRLSIVSMTVFGLVIVTFAQELSALMVDDQEVIRLTVLFIYLLGSMQPLMAIEFSIGGALRGAGDTRTPFIITVTCLILIRVLLALILFLIDAKVEFIFATLLIDYIVKGILFLWAYKSMRWLDAFKFSDSD
jgi:Na+-driven multidrug efflux pump